MVINAILTICSKLLVKSFDYLLFFFIIFALNFKELLLIKNGC